MGPGTTIRRSVERGREKEGMVSPSRGRKKSCSVYITDLDPGKETGTPEKKEEKGKVRQLLLDHDVLVLLRERKDNDH